MGVFCFKTNRHFFPRSGALCVQREVLLRHVYFCVNEIHNFYLFLTVFKILTLPTVVHYYYTVVQNDIDRKGVVNLSYLLTVQCIETQWQTLCICDGSKYYNERWSILLSRDHSRSLPDSNQTNVYREMYHQWRIWW